MNDKIRKAREAANILREYADKVVKKEIRLIPSYEARRLYEMADLLVELAEWEEE